MNLGGARAKSLNSKAFYGFKNDGETWRQNKADLPFQYQPEGEHMLNELMRNGHSVNKFSRKHLTRQYKRSLPCEAGYKRNKITGQCNKKAKRTRRKKKLPKCSPNYGYTKGKKCRKRELTRINLSDLPTHMNVNGEEMP